MMSTPVFGVVGWKNSGKTTLTERLVSEFTARGLTVSMVKHTHHNVDVDRSGTDSYRHRMAGAQEVMLAGGSRFALMHEYRDQAEFELDELLSRMAPCDLVLVEGFKRTPIPKLEVHREERQTSLLSETDASIVAVAADCEITGLDIPVFDLNDITSIADYIWKQIHA
jgi:molybdopterin-guanine dinucleotide biosynthesis protein B